MQAVEILNEPLLSESYTDTVSFGSAIISFEVTIRNRKTLSITVNPDGKVTVVAPCGSTIQQIEEKVKRRAAWIIKQQERFRRLESVKPARRFVSGETHYYLGRQYRLKIIESSEQMVRLRSGYIEVHTHDRTNSGIVERLLQDWYKVKAKEKMSVIFQECMLLVPTLTANHVRMKLQRMAKRWGSCTPSGSILLHPDLIKVTKGCIVYVILHELAHVIIPNHNKAFFELQAHLMPDWAKWKAKLEQFERLV